MSTCGVCGSTDFLLFRNKMMGREAIVHFIKKLFSTEAFYVEQVKSVGEFYVIWKRDRFTNVSFSAVETRG